jgi:hypothetical protein
MYIITKGATCFDFNKSSSGPRKTIQIQHSKVLLKSKHVAPILIIYIIRISLSLTVIYLSLIIFLTLRDGIYQTFLFQFLFYPSFCLIHWQFRFSSEICMRESHTSSLRQNTAFPETFHFCFSGSLHKSGTVPPVRARLLSSTSFPIRYSLSCH